MRNFVKNQQAIFWVVIVGTATIFIATIAWIAIIVISSQFVSSFSSQATGPATQLLGETELIVGSVTIVIIDIGMLIWMGVSAFIRERQEAPQGY